MAISCFLYDSFQQFVDQRVNNGWDFELVNPKYLEFWRWTMDRESVGIGIFLSTCQTFKSNPVTSICIQPSFFPSLLLWQQQVPSGTVIKCDRQVTAPAGCTCWGQMAVIGWSKPGANMAWTMGDGPCYKGGKTALLTSFGTGRTTR